MNELDLNLSRCLVEKQNLTYTKVTNICSGEVYEVPHGTVDYLFGGFISLIVIIGIGTLAFAIYSLFRDH